MMGAMTGLGRSTPEPTAPWWVRMRGPRAITWQSILVGNSLISLAILVSGGTLGGYASDADSGGSTVLGKSLVAVAIAGSGGQSAERPRT